MRVLKKIEAGAILGLMGIVTSESSSEGAKEEAEDIPYVKNFHTNLIPGCHLEHLHLTLYPLLLIWQSLA